MSFHEIVLNDAISNDPTGGGSSGGPGFSANFIESDGRKITVIVRQAQPQNRFEINMRDRDPAQLAQMRNFFLARGAGTGFRILWPQEHNSTTTGFYKTSGSGFTGTVTTSADQLIGTGDGSTVNYQLIKRYTDAAGTLTRIILKPVAGTVKVQVNGSDLTEGVDFTVNTTSGIVTLMVAPTSGHLVKAGFDFHFPVMFGPESTRAFVEQPGGMMVSGMSGAIDLIELLDPADFDEDWNYGGFSPTSMTANITLDLFSRLVELDPQSGSLTAQLPSPTTVPGGGPFLTIRNANASNTVDILDEAAATLATLGTSGGTIEVYNAGGTWIAADLGTT